jgi:hypothetical protein
MCFPFPVPSRTRLGVMYLAGYGIKRMVDVALQSVHQRQATLCLLWLSTASVSSLCTGLCCRDMLQVVQRSVC